MVVCPLLMYLRRGGNRWRGRDETSLRGELMFLLVHVRKGRQLWRGEQWPKRFVAARTTCYDGLNEWMRDNKRLVQSICALQNNQGLEKQK